MSDVYVVYHGDCADGFGAAWAAWKLFGDEAEYLPAYPGDGFQGTVAALLEAGPTTIYTVDICPNPAQMVELMTVAKKLVMIDHHATATEWYEGVVLPKGVERFHDESRSGAVLAWQYFHKEKKIPDILLYIEDRDLWKWELPDSADILTGMDAYPYTFRNMERLSGDYLQRLKVEGAAIIKWRNQLLELQLKNSHFVRLGDHVVPAVNCSIRALASESGHELLRRYPDAPFVASYRRNAEGTWDYSLRADGKFNVADFASKYAGGGGHPNAAGMTTAEPPEVANVG